MLFAEVLQLRFQCDWVRIGQRLQAVDTEFKQHVPALGADALTSLRCPSRRASALQTPANCRGRICADQPPMVEA